MDRAEPARRRCLTRWTPRDSRLRSLSHHHGLRPEETDGHCRCERASCQQTQWTPYTPVPLIRGRFHAVFSH